MLHCHGKQQPREEAQQSFYVSKWAHEQHGQRQGRMHQDGGIRLMLGAMTPPQQVDQGPMQTVEQLGEQYFRLTYIAESSRLEPVDRQIFNQSRPRHAASPNRI